MDGVLAIRLLKWGVWVFGKLIQIGGKIKTIYDFDEVSIQDSKLDTLRDGTLAKRHASQTHAPREGLVHVSRLSVGHPTRTSGIRLPDMLTVASMTQLRFTPNPGRAASAPNDAVETKQRHRQQRTEQQDGQDSAKEE